jgi:hypothetical protein
MKPHQNNSIFKVCSNLIITALLLPSFNLRAESDHYQKLLKAQRKERNQGTVNPVDLKNVTQGALGIYEQFNQIKMQNANMQAMQEMQKKMPQAIANNQCETLMPFQQLVQQCVMTPRTHPSDTQPQCQMLQGKSDKMTDLCSAVTNEQEYTEALLVSQQAITNANLYENNSDTFGVKEGTPEGVQCMEEQLALNKSLLRERAKKIDEFIRQLEDEQAKLEEMLRPDIMAMEQVQRELNGDETGALNTSIANMLPQGGPCSDIMEQSALESTKGLKHFLNQEVTKNLNVAQDLTKRELQITQEVNQAIGRLTNRMSEKAKIATLDTKPGDIIGLENSPQLSQFASIKEVVADVKIKLDTQHANLSRDLAALEIEKVAGPETNRILRAINDDRQDLSQAKQYIGLVAKRDCFKQSLNIENWQSRTDNRNNRVQSQANIDTFYRNIQQFIEDDNNFQTMDEKFNAMMDVAQKHDGLLINTGLSIRNKPNNHPWRASELIQIYRNDCVNSFENQIQPNGMRTSDILNSLDRIKQKRRDLYQKASADVAAEIRQRVLECKDISYTPSPTQCNKDKLNPNHASFCVTQSVQCASQINSCNDDVRKVITEKEEKRKTHATNYNNKVNNYQKTFAGIVKGMEQALINVNNNLRNSFRMTNFDLPPNNISEIFKTQIPEFNSEFGERLIDPKKGIELAIKQAKELRRSIAGTDAPNPNSPESDLSGGQNAEIVKVIEKAIENAKKQYAREAREWAELANRCNEQMANFARLRDENIAKQNEAIAEENKIVSELCVATAAATANPAAGTVRNLAEVLDKVTEKLGHRFTAEDSKALGEVHNYLDIIDQTQNHDSTPDAFASITGVNIHNICDQSEMKSNQACKDKKNFNKVKCEEYVVKLTKEPTSIDAKLSRECGSTISELDKKEAAIEEALIDLVISYNKNKILKEQREQFGPKFTMCPGFDDSGRGIMKDTMQQLKDMNNISGTAGSIK